jgi:hypothetical protein
MRRTLLVSGLLGTLLASPAYAQPTVAPGDTVQVALWSGGTALRGILQAATVDRITLRLGDGEDRVLPTSDVRTMNMLDGRKQAKGRWARGGFVVGMLAGATYSVAEHSGGSGNAWRKLGRMSVAALAGGLPGAVLGLAIGWNFEDNHWIAVRIPGPDTEREPARWPAAALVAGPGTESTVLVGVRLRR